MITELWVERTQKCLKVVHLVFITAIFLLTSVLGTFCICMDFLEDREYRLSIESVMGDFFGGLVLFTFTVTLLSTLRLWCHMRSYEKVTGDVSNLVEEKRTIFALLIVFSLSYLSRIVFTSFIYDFVK